jgi:hypothetical protein
MNEERNTIRVMVLCHNSAGEPDKFLATVPCSDNERALGLHYRTAKKLAAQAGYEPRMCVDEKDALWSQIHPNHQYQQCLENILVDFQHVYMPGQECNGGDLVEQLGEHIRTLMTDVLPGVGVSTEFCFGFKDGSYLLGETVLDSDVTPRGTLRAQDIEQMARMDATLVRIPFGDLQELNDCLPNSDALAEAAKSAAHRSGSYAFAIDESNAVGVMAEELARYGQQVPRAFAPILKAAFFHHKERMQEQVRDHQREGQ